MKIKIFAVFTLACFLSLKGLSQTLNNAINGLTKDGNTVSLGGTLTTADVSIDLGASYFFKLKKSTQDYLNVINNGNVGIGVTTPLYKLDVNGALRIGSLTTDPTGAAGVMYYNSTLNKLKAYVNGGWKNFLMEGDATGSFIENQNASAQTGNFWINGSGTIGSSLAINSGSTRGRKFYLNGSGWIEYGNLKLGYEPNDWDFGTLQIHTGTGLKPIVVTSGNQHKFSVDDNGTTIANDVYVGGYFNPATGGSQIGYSANNSNEAIITFQQKDLRIQPYGANYSRGAITIANTHSPRV